MPGTLPWHDLWSSLLLGFLGAALLLYLFSFRRYETYRTAARLLVLVSVLWALLALGTGLRVSPVDLTLLAWFHQHQALGIATLVLVLLTALFALVEPLASWLPGFTLLLLLLSGLAVGATWVHARAHGSSPSAPAELLQESPEVEPDTGEVWMEELPQPPEP